MEKVAVKGGPPALESPLPEPSRAAPRVTGLKRAS